MRRHFSPKILLGGLATAELILRLFLEIPLARLGDASLLPTAVSVFFSNIALFPGIQLLINWLFIISVLSLFASKIYRIEPDWDFQDRAGFKLIAIISSFLFFLLAYAIVLEIWSDSESLPQPYQIITDRTYIYFFGAVIGSLALFLTYFILSQEKSFLNPEGNALQIPIWTLQAEFPENDTVASFRYERDAYAEKGGVALVLFAVLNMIMIGLLHTLPAACLGIMIGLMNSLFPLLELLTLGWLVSHILIDRLEVWRGWSFPLSRLIEIEDEFYQGVAIASHPKGLSAILIIIFGLELAASMFVLTFGLLTGSAGDYFIVRFNAAIGRLLRAPLTYGIYLNIWNAMGEMISLSTLGLYGVWFWFRELRRVPRFLRKWDENVLRETRIGGISYGGELVPRPPGLMLPPTLMFAVWSLYFGSRIEFLRSPFVFAIVWPVLALTVTWTIWRGIYGKPQSPETDSYALPVAVTVQAIIPGGAIWFIPATRSGLSLPSLAAICVIVSYFFFIEDVHQYAKRSEGVLGFSNSAYLGLGGVIIFCFGFLNIRYFNAWVMYAGAGLVVLGLVVHPLVKIYGPEK